MEGKTNPIGGKKTAHMVIQMTCDKKASETWPIKVLW